MEYSLSDLYIMFLFATLDERLLKIKMAPDFIEDLIVGFVGFPSSNPMSKFTKDHGISYKPENLEKIEFEIITLIKETFPITEFSKLTLTSDEIIKMMSERLAIPINVRIASLKDSLAKNWYGSKEEKKHNKAFYGY